MWDINQFVEILNQKLPLVNINKDDKRKSNIWTVRMVREYCSKHNIKGVKKGKFLYYTQENLEKLQEIMTIKSIADVTSKNLSYSSVSEIKNLRSFSGNEDNKKDVISIISNSIGSQMLNNNSSSERIDSLFREGVKKYKDPNIEINKDAALSLMVAANNKSNILREKKAQINISDNIDIIAPENMSNSEIIKNIKQWLYNIGE